MKSISNQYKDLLEGAMSQAQFMRNVRMSLPQYITNVTSFSDAKKILKNKGILTESLAIDDEGMFNRKRKWSKNPGAEAYDRINKGNGDERDEDVLAMHTGIGPSTNYTGWEKDREKDPDDLEDTLNSMRPNMAFSLSEDEDIYTQVLADVKQQIQSSEFGVDQEFIDNCIGVAVGEYGLSEEQEESLKADIFDQRNDENNIEYDDLDEGPDDEEEFPDFGFDNTPIQEETTQDVAREFTKTLVNDFNKSKEDAIDILIKIRQGDQQTIQNMRSNPTTEPYIAKLEKNNLNEGKKLKADQVNPHELRMGRRVEMEHTTDHKIAEKIALDHLSEDPFYYTKLKHAGLADELKPKKTNDQYGKVGSDKSNEMKPVKGAIKHKADSGAKKETTVPAKKVQVLTHASKRAKGIKQTMNATGGNYKKVKLKEVIDALITECMCEMGLQAIAPSDIDGMKSFILANNEVFSQPAELTQEKLDQATDNYIKRLYDAVQKKVKDNQQLGDQEPEMYNLQEDDMSSDTSDEEYNTGSMTEEQLDEDIDLTEVKAIELKVGADFDVQGDIGKFKKGDKVTVTKKVPTGEDIELHLKNQNGVEDVFYIDKDDDVSDITGTEQQ